MHLIKIKLLFFNNDYKYVHFILENVENILKEPNYEV